MHVIYYVERVLPVKFCLTKSLLEITILTMKVKPGAKTTELPAEP